MNPHDTVIIPRWIATVLLATPEARTLIGNIAVDALQIALANRAQHPQDHALPARGPIMHAVQNPDGSARAKAWRTPPPAEWATGTLEPFRIPVGANLPITRETVERLCCMLAVAINQRDEARDAGQSMSNALTEIAVALREAGHAPDPATDEIASKVRGLTTELLARRGLNANYDRTFGWAIYMLRHGHIVTRAGWNGRGMYLALQRPDENSKMTLPYIYMRTVQGDLVPWLASQTDILAEDWSAAPAEPSAAPLVDPARRDEFARWHDEKIAEKKRVLNDPSISIDDEGRERLENEISYHWNCAAELRRADP